MNSNKSNDLGVDFKLIFLYISVWSDFGFLILKVHYWFLHGCNPLVYWSIHSNVCQIWSSWETWIYCMFNCCKIFILPLHSSYFIFFTIFTNRFKIAKSNTHNIFSFFKYFHLVCVVFQAIIVTIGVIFGVTSDDYDWDWWSIWNSKVSCTDLIKRMNFPLVILTIWKSINVMKLWFICLLLYLF